MCHGPMGLVKAKDGDKALVAGKKIAAFSDVEEGQARGKLGLGVRMRGPPAPNPNLPLNLTWP